MASIGLKYVAWAQMATEPDNAIPTYGTGIELGKAVSANLTVTNSEAELYANDMLAEYVSEFVSAELTMEVDNISLQNQATLYGASYVDGELAVSTEDTAPYGGIGGYQVLMVHGERKYRSYFFPKAKASMPDWTGTTKGQSISFGTQPLNLRIAAPEFGKWYFIKEFDNEAAAKAWVDAKVGTTSTYNINIMAQGANGTTKVASPVGVVAAPAGETFEIAITGTLTALYDNGAEKKSSVAGGKYTLSALAADHEIAIVFS